MRRTHGRCQTASSSITACVGKSIRPSPNAPSVPRAFSRSTLPQAQSQQYLDNPQPGYKTNLDSFAPRVQVDWRVTGTTPRPCRRRHHHHSAQYLAGQLPHRSGPVRDLSPPGDLASRADRLRLPDHLGRTAKLLHSVGSECLRQRQDQSRPRKHRARCRTLPAGPRRALSRELSSLH